jgi:hypothetical protein
LTHFRSHRRHRGRVGKLILQIRGRLIERPWN